MKLSTQSITAFTALMGLMWWSKPSLALEVNLWPEKPDLGDTISVIISTDSQSATPTVSSQGRDHPVFPLENQNNAYRALIPTTPLDSPGNLVIQVSDGQTTQEMTIFLANKEFPTQSIRLTGAAAKPATTNELTRVREFKQLVTPEKFWSGPFVRPSPARVSAVFGVQRYINGKFVENYYHRGVDYAGEQGSPVFAPAGGRIALVGTVAEGFDVHGNTIGIDHGQGVLSIFLHLEDIYVEEGEQVAPGQKIGTVGSTGASTGPHLHWGLYVNGISVDPVPWRFEGFE